LATEKFKKFLFLSVGVAIRRKGRDLLPEAYEAAFEEVRLLLVVPGTGRAYHHNSLTRRI
jgi:glycogen synthase